MAEPPPLSPLDMTPTLRQELAEAENEKAWAEIRLARMRANRDFWRWAALVLLAALVIAVATGGK